MIEVGYWFKQFPFHPMDLAAGPYNPTGLTENRLPKWFFNSKNCLMQKKSVNRGWTFGFENHGWSSQVQLKAFLSFYFGTYRLSHCWIFILQPWTFGSRHHFLLFFFSVSLALSIMVLVTAVSAFFSLRFFFFFSDCCFCIFLSLCVLPLHSAVFWSTLQMIHDGQLAFQSSTKQLLSTTLFLKCYWASFFI